MTLSAVHTERIGIGAAVTDPYSVHPALTAAAMATVDDISSGRVIVGIGAGGSGFPAMGIQRERPVAAMADAIAIMRGMWAGRARDAGRQGRERPQRRPGLRRPPRHPHRHRIPRPGGVSLGRADRRRRHDRHYGDARGRRHGLGFHPRGRGAGRSPTPRRSRSSPASTPAWDPDRDKARSGVRQMIAFLLWSSYPNRNFVTSLGMEVPAELEAMIAKRGLRVDVQGRPLGARGVHRRLRLGRHPPRK